MTNEGLHSLLEKLNSNIDIELIHRKQISQQVDFAKVWLDNPNLTNRPSNKNGPDHFYFIKNEKVFSLLLYSIWGIMIFIGMSILKIEKKVIYLII